MQHHEQIKQLLHSEIERFTTITGIDLIKTTNQYEEYKVTFRTEFNPIYLRSFSNGTIKVKYKNSYHSVLTVDSSCCYLYAALIESKQS